MLEANYNPADYGENLGRGTLNYDKHRMVLISHLYDCLAVACEALARRIVHQSPRDRLTTIMSTRYKHRQADGDIEISSALELAIDSHW